METTLAPVQEYLATSFPDGDREYIDGAIRERNLGEGDHAWVQSRLVVYFAIHFPKLWTVAELRVQVSSTRYRIPDVFVAAERPPGRIATTPPLLVVEVLSPDDRVGDLEEKLADYFGFGVPCAWVINPRTRRGFVHTPGRNAEVSDGVLTTPDGRIEAPLESILEPAGEI